jgi:SPP1 family predicted phage head-tail adaptor
MAKCCDPKNAPANFRHRITFQSLSLTPNDSGGNQETWTDTTSAWASIKPKIIRESNFAQRVESRIDHDIRIRYQAGLNTTMRIVFGSRIFEIKSLIIEDEIKEFISILAAERTGT